MSMKEVAVVSVPVSDQEVAKEFYVNKLGLEPKRDDTSVPGMRWTRRWHDSASGSLGDYCNAAARTDYVLS